MSPIKKQLCIVVSGMVLALLAGRSDGAPAPEEVRTFTDTQGRKIDGHIMAYDAATQIVTMKRADGKTGKLSLNSFIEEDRLHIQDWSFSEAFLKGLVLTTDLTTTNVPPKKAGITDGSKRVFDSVYEIELSNPTTFTFEKMDLEYCIFYRQGTRNGIMVNYDEGIAYNKQRLAVVKPKDTISLKTTAIRLYSEVGSQTLFGQMSLSDAGIRGIWVKLTISLPSGGQIVREYRTADDDYWKWTPGSVGVGLNQGGSLRDFSVSPPR